MIIFILYFYKCSYLCYRGIRLWDADSTKEDIGPEHLLMTWDQVTYQEVKV